MFILWKGLAIMTKNKGGAPTGNRNAAKPTQRVMLQVRVAPETIATLTKYAEQTSQPVGRLLDYIINEVEYLIEVGDFTISREAKG